MNKLRYIIVVGLLCVTSVVSAKQFTLVIDAGHGGHDAGACGAISKEKNLTLKFALAFGQLVERNCPDVKVVYTRKTDKFVELYKRAEIANNQKADLFISIHINAVPKGHQASGFQTYTLGKSRRTGKKNGVQENLEVAKRENSVIYLESDYKQTYHGYDPNSPESNILFEFVQDKNMENSIELAKYMQRYVCQATNRQDMGAHQDNLAVLRLTSMPGCLIELGFISNRDEEQFMNSAGAADKYARGIYNAFVAYKRKFSGTINVPFMPEPKELPEKKEPEKKEPVKKEQSEKKDTLVVQPVQTVQPTKLMQQSDQPEPVAAPVFKVQFLVTSKRLPASDSRLKGLEGTDCYEENGMVKYTIGASTDYQEIYQLRKSVLDKFPEAFVIAFRNGQRMNVQEAIREYRNEKVKK